MCRLPPWSFCSQSEKNTTSIQVDLFPSHPEICLTLLNQPEQQPQYKAHSDDWGIWVKCFTSNSSVGYFCPSTQTQQTDCWSSCYEDVDHLILGLTRLSNESLELFCINLALAVLFCWPLSGAKSPGKMKPDSWCRLAPFLSALMSPLETELTNKLTFRPVLLVCWTRREKQKHHMEKQENDFPL